METLTLRVLKAQVQGSSSLRVPQAPLLFHSNPDPEVAQPSQGLGAALCHWQDMGGYET